jgi:hypothetical protein
MKVIIGKVEHNWALLAIAIFLLGIYQVFNKENFITLENWGEYVFAPVYFLGPALGIIAGIRTITSAASWDAKLLSYAVLITSVSYLVALLYGFYLELKS